MVMEAVYWFGLQGYEGRVAELWAALCRRSRSVLEVGGNVGLFSVVGGRAMSEGAAGEGASYVVAEPVPGNAALLRANLARNGLGSRVDLREIAAVPGAQACTVRLNIPEEGRAAPVGAHLMEGSEVPERGSARVIEVRGVPFRELLAGRDLLKIDAEGIEAALLASARDLIEAARPSLLIEVLPEATRLASLLAELARSCGYTISVIPEWGSDTIVTVRRGRFRRLRAGAASGQGRAAVGGAGGGDTAVGPGA